MKRMAKIAMGVGVLALAGGGMSWAAVPDSDDSEYHACVQNTSSSLKAVYMLDKEAGDCPGGFTEKTWNQVGQTGATGPQGPAGEGVAGYEVVESANEEFPGGTSSSAVATCPSGKRVVGGGFENSVEDTHMIPTMNRPSAIGDDPVESWTVRFWNTDTSAHFGKAFAVCISD